MRIIPAIDIIGGKCVRLTKGLYETKKIYNEDPLEVAMAFEDNGIGYLHLVDLDGAKNNKPQNIRVLEKIAARTTLKIDFGGGIRNDEDIRSLFNAGAVQITGGSIAARDPEIFMAWFSKYGPEKIILGADFSDGKVAVSGWMESSGIEITGFISDYSSRGLKYCICTDISKDGMLSGPSIDIYGEIVNKTDINLIASGGITSMEDIFRLVEIGCEGAIIGKAIYEGKLTLKELGRLC